MEASAKFADASILMRKIGFVVVLLRGLLSVRLVLSYRKREPYEPLWFVWLSFGGGGGS